MKRISCCTRVAIRALLAWSSITCAAPSVDLYVPEAPPLTMLTVGDQHGIVGDIALKAMASAGYSANTLSPPWPRAQREVSQGKDLLIAPLTRNQSREANYTWIAPILTMDRAFFSLDRRVESFDEARKTFRLIAVGIGTAQETRLREEGFADSQIYPLKIGENPAQMLLKGRVDAWFNGVPESRYIWQQLTDRPLVMSRVVMTANLYLACSKDCDPQMVSRLRAAIDTLEKDGTIDRVEAQYTKGLPVR
ncbi:substrate-binding periplasmic protein [Pseudomonas sp. NPDC090203]|jgi:polar amino acid transport system substrate-binding protein|uniref:substrate-binding periplasmic protein n=1 Tax=Pseudomonas sp. NPDC090203 TaxID=3364477 RepID=UPI00382D27FF